MSANKYVLEKQLDFFNEKNGDAPKNKMDLYGDASHERQLSKVTEEDIASVKEFIAKNRKDYPGSLEDLFQQYEATLAKYRAKYAQDKRDIIQTATADTQKLKSVQKAVEKKSDLMQINGESLKNGATLKTRTRVWFRVGDALEGKNILDAGCEITLDTEREKKAFDKGAEKDISMVPVIVNGVKGYVAEKYLVEASKYVAVTVKKAPTSPVAKKALETPKTVASTETPKAKPSMPKRAPETLDATFRELENAYSGWLESVKGADRGFLSNTNETIKSDLENINLAEQRIANSITLLSKYNIDTTKQERVQNILMSIASYRSDKIKNIKNAHFKSYEKSTEILSGILQKKVKLPSYPSENDIITALKPETKQMLITQIRAGKTLSEALSNPAVKGGWDEVVKTSLEKHDKEIVKLIKEQESAGLPGYTSLEKRAIDLLGDIYGAGMFDLKARNEEIASRIGKGAIAIAAGIGAVAALSTAIGTPIGLTLWGVAVSAAGGAVSTVGMMMAENRRYDLGESGVEFGINTATFLVGWVILKMWKYIQGESRVLSMRGGAAYAFEATGDVAIGAVSDKTRALYKGIGLSWTEAFENNLIWALTPLAFRGTKLWKEIPQVRRELAERTARRSERMATAATLGDRETASTIMREATEDIGTVRATEATPEVRPATETSPVNATERPTVTAAEPRAYSVEQTLNRARDKAEFINNAQTGDKIRLKNMGTIEKLADGRWEHVNGTSRTYYNDNADLLSQAISGSGKGSKNFVIERLGPDVHSSATTGTEASGATPETASTGTARTSAEWTDSAASSRATTTPEAVTAGDFATNKKYSIEKLISKDVSMLKKTGQKQTYGDVTIEKTVHWYKLTLKDQPPVEYSSKEILMKELNAKFATPEAKLALMRSITNSKIEARLKLLDGKEVAGTNLRIVKEDKGFKVQEKQGDGWVDKGFDSLNEAQSQLIAEAILGKRGFALMAKEFASRFSKNPEESLSEAEKKSFISKYGSKAYKGAVEKYKDFQKGVVGDAKKVGKGTLSLTRWVFFGNPEGGPLSARGLIGMSLGVVANEVYDQTHKGDEKWREDFWTLQHGADVIFNLFLVRQVGWARAVIYNIVGTNLFDNGVEYVEEKYNTDLSDLK